MRLLTSVFFAVFVVLAAACSDDVEPGGGDGSQDVASPADASDTPELDTASSPQDASTDASDTSASDTADTSGACTPGESWCESVTVRGKCSATSGEAYTYECNSNQVCRDGECVEGEPCEPQAVLGCAGEQSVTVCNERGDDTRTQVCPAETPECVEGSCVARTCTPGELSCQNDQVRRCNERGLGTELVEQCAHQCSNAACQFPDYTDCPPSGCEFFAIDMDNRETRCDSVLVSCTMHENECSIDYPSSDCQFSCVQGICAPTSSVDMRPFGVRITNPGAQPLSVQITDGAGNMSHHTVPANDATSIGLDEQTVHDTSLTSYSYRIITDGAADVSQFNPAYGPQGDLPVLKIGDSAALLPASAVGTEYVIVGWHSYEFYTPLDRAYMTIVATADGTQVGVTSPVDLLPGAGVPAVAASSTHQFQLDRGEVLQLLADPTFATKTDLNGAQVQSTKPVTVFTGHECASIPTGVTSCDHLEEQLLPVSSWGSEYVAAKFSSDRLQNFQEPDIYRVVAASDDTTISTTPAIAGAQGAQLDRGDFIEFETNEDFILTASAPVQLAQFMVGGHHPSRLGPAVADPSIMLPAPSSMHRARHIISVPSGFDENHISIKAPGGAAIFLDDELVTATAESIPGTSWQVWRLPIDEGTHEIRGSQPFGVDIYGYAKDLSYAHPAGWDLR